MKADIAHVQGAAMIAPPIHSTPSLQSSTVSANPTVNPSAGPIMAGEAKTWASHFIHRHSIAPPGESAGQSHVAPQRACGSPRSRLWCSRAACAEVCRLRSPHHQGHTRLPWADLAANRILPREEGPGLLF